MKAYTIKDEIRKLKGKNEYTNYEYCCERDEQVRKRLSRYRREGYNVETKQDWWTTIQIVLKEAK
jgi:hypothetical protein